MRSLIYLVLLLIVFISVFATPAKKHKRSVITMKGMKFTPASIEISVGDTVIWINEGGHHNVVANDGSFKSPMTKKGESYALVFEKKGSYKYYCQPHRIMGMKGVVEVKE